jgi:hypothetical protein
VTVALSDAERDIMEHATAWKNGRFRNHYAADEETDVWSTLISLTARGMLRVAVKPEPFFGSMTIFSVTENGQQALEQ